MTAGWLPLDLNVRPEILQLAAATVVDPSMTACPAPEISRLLSRMGAG